MSASRLIELRDRLHAVLIAESEKRDSYSGTGWIAAEREAMLRATNSERTAGHPPVEIADIVRVETMACGHSDYGSKFALYCAELALHGIERGP